MKLTVKDGEVFLDEKNITDSLESLELFVTKKREPMLKLTLKCDSDVSADVGAFVIKSF